LGGVEYLGAADIVATGTLTATGYRERTGEADIVGDATVTAYGSRVQSSAGYITCNAEVVVNASAIYNASGAIVGYANLSANGHILGSGWVNTPVSPNTWTRKDNLLYVELDYVVAGYVDAQANYWVQPTASSNTWLIQG
jgi:hypothetical protein